MKSLLKQRSGESFIEILVALFVIAISIMVALNLLITTTDSTASNRNFLIADGLAVEGVEAFYNIITTNVLKHGVENAESCWLVYQSNPVDQEFTAEECENNKIIDGAPKVETFLKREYAEPDLHWQLDRLDSELDLADSPETALPFQLYTAKFTDDPNDPLFGSFYYTNESFENTASSFYRSIMAELDPLFPNEVQLVVKIQWEEANRVREVTKVDAFSNTNFIEQ